MKSGNRKVAIAGVGYSGIYRGSCPSPEQLTLESCMNAIEDAGLLPSAVDGVFEYQYAGDSPYASYVRQALGTSDLAAYGDIMGTGPSGLASALAAHAAVSSGACETAIAIEAFNNTLPQPGLPIMHRQTFQEAHPFPPSLPSPTGCTHLSLTSA